jgi:hypothetical protein
MYATAFDDDVTLGTAGIQGSTSTHETCSAAKHHTAETVTPAAALCYLRVVAVGQRGDEIVCRGGPRSVLNFLLSGSRLYTETRGIVSATTALSYGRVTQEGNATRELAEPEKWRGPWGIHSLPSVAGRFTVLSEHDNNRS